MEIAAKLPISELGFGRGERIGNGNGRSVHMEDKGRNRAKGMQPGIKDRPQDRLPEGPRRKYIRQLEAGDERQHMMNEKYEVYEKQGAPLGAATFHHHSFYEIIYVLEGEYSSMVEDRTYNLRKGDFLLIDINVLHKYNYIEKKHDSSKRIILWISAVMLEHLSEGEMDLTACFANHENCVWHFPIYYEEMLRGYLLKLAMSGGVEEELPGAKSVMDRGCLALFFSYLNVLCGRKDYLSVAEKTEHHELVEQVSRYVDAHMEERITVDALAKQVHMSKYYFLRRFKELTGLTVHTYIIQKRLILACEGLRQGKSVKQVYQECGFTDYSSFLRNFKENYEISPGKYIKDYQFL
ncbi:MAG: helix-turn-helix domain-containing protein [Acetatifactor sp.]